MIDELKNKTSKIRDGQTDSEPAPKVRSREEINELKDRWMMSENKWQLENTQGFEAHRTELTAFSNRYREKYGEEENTEGEPADKDDNARIIAELEMETMCPISMLQGRGAESNCIASECAWWNELDICCSVKSLAIASCVIARMHLPRQENTG